MPNTHLTRKRRVSAFRTIAIGTWRTTKDPSVYGAVSLDVEPALAYVEAYRERTGKRLTLSHLMAKAVGLTLARVPDANAILRFNRIYLRRDVGVFFQVATRDEHGEVDLAGLTVRHADRKSVAEICDEFDRVETVRAGEDEEVEETKRTFTMVPTFAVGWLLDAIGFLIFGLNLDLRWAGLPHDPFGSVMVTNVGALGIEEAFAPLVPYSRVPLVVSMGAVRQIPVVDAQSGELRAGQVMRVCATFDHRLLDGAHAAMLGTSLQEIFADPESSFGPLP